MSSKKPKNPSALPVIARYKKGDTLPIERIEIGDLSGPGLCHYYFIEVTRIGVRGYTACALPQEVGNRAVFYYWMRKLEGLKLPLKICDLTESGLTETEYFRQEWEKRHERRY